MKKVRTQKRWIVVNSGVACSNTLASTRRDSIAKLGITTALWRERLKRGSWQCRKVELVFPG